MSYEPMQTTKVLLDGEAALNFLAKLNPVDVQIKASLPEVVKYVEKHRPSVFALVHKYPRDGDLLVQKLVSFFNGHEVPVILVASKLAVTQLKRANKKGVVKGSTCAVVTDLRGMSLDEFNLILKNSA